LNGGSQAVIVRIQKGGKKAEITALKLEAASEGEWGNNLFVGIDDDGITDDVAENFHQKKADLFNLSVYVSFDLAKPSAPVERFLNVSVQKDAGGRRLDRVLEQDSKYIRASDLPAARPANGKPQQLKGGKKSDSLTKAEFIGKEKDKSGM